MDTQDTTGDQNHDHGTSTHSNPFEGAECVWKQATT